MLPLQRVFSSHILRLSHLSAQQTTLLMKCFCVYVDAMKNSNLNVSSKKAPWKRTFLKTTTQYHALKIKTKTVPVSLGLLFSWSSYQLQCLEDLLFLFFQSIKRRETISGLENSMLETLKFKKKNSVTHLTGRIQARERERGREEILFNTQLLHVGFLNSKVGFL